MTASNLPAQLDATDRRWLLDLARRSIAVAARTGRMMDLERDRLPASLHEKAATFVTLREGGRLRGCIGTLEARRPLGVDVVEHAFAAAMRDPRFPPVTVRELATLEIEISVLTKPEAMAATTEQEAARELRPGVDGLILETGGRRGTFLPAVWETLPDPVTFIAHLKQKVGLSPHASVGRARWRRYQVEKIAEVPFDPKCTGDKAAEGRGG